jgi:hypothetical protein
MMSRELTTIEDDEATGFGGGILAQAPTAALAVQLAAAVLDKRIATARTYPRSIAMFKKEAASLLKEDVETARSAEYAKPVGKGVVRGASVRMAELAAMCWRNLDVEVHEPIVGDKSVSVKAVAWDLERNYRQEAVVTTSILGRDGRRYPAHLVETAALATASKAKRNAILSVIPRAFIQDLLEQARKVASENEKPLDQLRLDMLDYFARAHKVNPEQVFALLEVPGIDDITEDHIATLRGIVTAIKQEGTPITDFFQQETATKTEAIKAKLNERRAAKPEQTPQLPAQTQTPTTAQTSPPPPPPPPPPAAPRPDMLAGLIAQAEQQGCLVEWLEKERLLIEDAENARGKQRSEMCDSLSKFLKSKMSH